MPGPPNGSESQYSFFHYRSLQTGKITLQDQFLKRQDAFVQFATMAHLPQLTAWQRKTCWESFSLSKCLMLFLLIEVLGLV